MDGTETINTWDQKALPRKFKRDENLEVDLLCFVHVKIIEEEKINLILDNI